MLQVRVLVVTVDVRCLPLLPAAHVEWEDTVRCRVKVALASAGTVVGGRGL